MVKDGRFWVPTRLLRDGFPRTGGEEEIPARHGAERWMTLYNRRLPMCPWAAISGSCYKKKRQSYIV